MATSSEELKNIDSTKSLIEEKIASGSNSFEVEYYENPRVIYLKGYRKPIKLASVITYSDMGNKDTPGLEKYKKDVEDYYSKIIKPGTKVSIQLMPDSYYYDDQALKSYSSREVDAIVYLNNIPLQSMLVENGMAVYNTDESFRINDIFLSIGDIDRTFSEVLKDAEIKSLNSKAGFWKDEYALYNFRASVVGKYNKTLLKNPEKLKETYDKVVEYEKKRINNPTPIGERRQKRFQQKEDEKKNFTRFYSASSIGETLSRLAKEYLPAPSSGTIVESIVAGIYPKSCTQIGVLWSGIPTAEEEFAGLGASSHPVEIVEVRKDGDVRPILGQGFLSMVMGDRPPDEGLTLIFTANSRGIEHFIAPLLTQFRMDPIIPIRNLHLARFVRPIFSNREFYSSIFGKLPKDITSLVDAEGNYNVKDENNVRELSRILDYMYLAVPVYVAVKRVQVNNLKNNNGSYTITIDCQIADMSENFGNYPEYFKTIDDAFQVHEKRAQVIDKVNTEAAIKHIAEQIGSGSLIATYTRAKTDIEKEEDSVGFKINKIKSTHVPNLNPDSDVNLSDPTFTNDPVPEGAEVSGFVLREGIFIEVPRKISIAEAAKQAKGKEISKFVNFNPDRNTIKIPIGRLLCYKPAVGFSASYSLAKTIIGLTDIKSNDELNIKELRRFLSVNREFPSKMPIPIIGNFVQRTGNILNQDLENPSNSPLLRSIRSLEFSKLIDDNLMKTSSDLVASLFSISSKDSGFSIYKYGFSNWKQEVLLNTTTTPIVKPFELCATTNTSYGETVVANLMEFEYAIGYGLPFVTASRSGNTITLKLLENSYSLTGTIRNVNNSIGIFEFSEDKVPKFFSDSLLSVVKSNSFFPELTSTFSFSIKSNILKEAIANGVTKVERPRDVSSVVGTLGSLKFHCSSYKNLVSIKTTQNKLNISRNISVSRDQISQRTEIWKQERCDYVWGTKQKEPFNIEVSIPNSSGSSKVKLGLTNVTKSDVGNYIFVFKTQDTSKTTLVLRSVKFESDLIHLLYQYFTKLKPVNEEANSTSNNVSKKELDTLRKTFSNLVQSVVNKSKKDPLEGLPIPNSLTNISQVLATSKSKAGTKYIDESEPYFFSLMFQLGRVSPSNYTMTFKVRPDRVPYKKQDFINSDVTTMELEIFRPEAPKEDSRFDAFTKTMQENEKAIERTSSNDGINSEINTLTLGLIQGGGLNPTNSKQQTEDSLKRPIYVIAAIQGLLLRYLDFAYSAHLVAKGGQVLVNKGSISTPSSSNKKEVGLADKELNDVVYKQIRDEVQKEIKKIEDFFKKLAQQNLTQEETNRIIDSNIRSLYRITEEVDSRLTDSKTSNGQPFMSIENIKRLFRFGQLDSSVTRNVITDILLIYKQTIDVLLEPSKLRTFYTVKAGQIDLFGSNSAIASRIVSLYGKMETLLSFVKAIRLASGESLDFMKRKRMVLKKPIPSIGVVEEYGISNPIKAPGKKKPTYQVVASTSTTAYIQFETNISELYISENSKLQDVVNEEEGMDAIYNMIREPGEITTIYNMLRSGRAMVRDSRVFTQGSTNTIRGNVGTQSIESAFRLVRRASLNAAQADSLSVLLGLSEPHVKIEEPLFLALGLNRFVAKTTKLSSQTNTTSWKVDVFLLPYEAGYTTNRNLKKVNRSISNQDMGNICSWLNAADSLYSERIIGADQLKILNLANTVGNNAIIDNQMEYRRAEALIRSSKMATAAVFSNIVATYAIYRAKKLVLEGVRTNNLLKPDWFTNSNNIKSLAPSIGKNYRGLLSEFDIKGSQFANSSIYGSLGSTASIPIGAVEGFWGGIASGAARISDIGALAIPAVDLGSAGLGRFFSPVKNFNTKYFRVPEGGGVSPLYKISGALSALSICLDITAGFQDRELAYGNTQEITAAYNNNITHSILLSQDFSVYALEFIEEFAARESINQGQSFLEEIAREAESVIQNAGEVSSIQVLGQIYFQDETAPQDVLPTASGYIVSSYPVGSIIQYQQQKDFIEYVTPSGEEKKIENVSICIINASGLSTAGQVNSQLTGALWKDAYNDFYPSSSGDYSFFGRYFSTMNSSSSGRKTDLDTCGEELLSLMMDSQLMIYETDIYSIALAPKFIRADVSFYYNGLRAIWGRLKVNHFATHLLSQHYNHVQQLKLSVFTPGSDMAKALDLFGIGVVSDLNLKKTKNYESLKLVAEGLLQRGSKSDFYLTMVDISEAFPLVNFRQILYRIVEAVDLFHDSVTRSLNSRDLGPIENIQFSLAQIVDLMSKQAPENKRSKFRPIPVQFSISNIENYSPDKELTPETYSIPASGSLETFTRDSNKYANKSFNEYSLLSFKSQIGTSLVSHIAWILDSYSIIVDGASKADFLRTDPSYDLKESILTQLSLDLSKELSISFDQAKAQVIAEINFTPGSSVSNTLSQEVLSKIQKACDEITLYSGNEQLGKSAVFREYSSFVSTFKEIFLQQLNVQTSSGLTTKSISAKKDLRTNEVSLLSSESTSPESFLYKNKKAEQVWLWDERTDILETEKSLLSPSIYSYTGGNNVRIAFDNSYDRYRNLLSTTSFSSQRNSTSLDVYSSLSFFSFGETGSRSYNRSLIKTHRYFQLKYGVERPEFIPAVLYSVRLVNNPNAGLVRTDMCLDFFRSYSHFFSLSFDSKLRGLMDQQVVGNNSYLSTGAILKSAERAATIALIVSSLGAGLVAAVIVGVVLFVCFLLYQFIQKSKGASDLNLHKDFISRLRARVGSTGIATTPLFTGMKALLEIASVISEMDLIPVSTYSVITYGSNSSSGFRKEYAVYPPDISSSLNKSEYLLQDTLSYLTLPLITKRNVTYVTDVLAPGGWVVPNMEKVNENAQSLSSALLIQESFFKDEVETIPDYIKIQKAKAQGLNASNLAADDPLSPRDPIKKETGYYQGFIRFIDNMQGIFIGRVFQNETIAGKPNQLKLDTSFSKNSNLYPYADKELIHIYSYLAPRLTGLIEASFPDKLGRIRSNFLGTTDATVSGKLSKDSSLLDILSEITGRVFDSAKYRSVDIKKNANNLKDKFESVVAEAMGDAFVASKEDKNLAYSLVINSSSLLKGIFGERFIDGLTGDASRRYNSLTSAGLPNKPFRDFISNEQPLYLKFMTYPETNVGTFVPGTMYLKANGKVITVTGDNRGDTGNFIKKQRSVLIRQATPQARNVGRASSQKNDEGIAFKIENDFSIFENTIPFYFSSSSSPGFAIFRHKDLENNILQNRRNYIMIPNMTAPEAVRTGMEGECFLKAADSITNGFSYLQQEIYMEVPLKDIGKINESFSFIDIYAIKLAYEETSPGIELSDSPKLQVRWSHVVTALRDFGSYLRYISYAYITSSTLQGFETSSTSILIDKTNKAIPTKLNSTSELENSDTSKTDTVNTLFAATSGLGTQLVLEKIDRYLDSFSVSLNETTGRLNKETKNLLMSPVRAYPVVKLYFVRKGKGESILYDDLFSYADILSATVFESQKSPGSYLEVVLANTENKLDNILQAKDNTMNPFEIRARNEDPLSGIMLKAGTRIILYMGYGNVLTEEEKFLGEIETVQTNPDGTVKIIARGPGWVLNNRLNQSISGEGKILNIDYREVNDAVPFGGDTAIPVTEFSNPIKPMAKGLLLYGLISKGKLDRYGRLGSIVNELSETMSNSFPPNILDSYTSMIQNGIITSQNITNDLKSLYSKLKDTFAGVSFVADSPSLYLEKTTTGDTKLYRQTTVAKNILPEAGYPQETTIYEDLQMFSTSIFSFTPASKVAQWRINNESYWEFLKEATLPLGNTRHLVRSFNNDGSLVIGQYDEYYTMYTPKTLSSKLSSKLRETLLGFKSKKIEPAPKDNSILPTVFSQDNIDTIKKSLGESFVTVRFAKNADGTYRAYDTVYGNPSEKQLILDALKKGSSRSNYSDMIRSFKRVLIESFSKESAREAVSQVFTSTLAGLASGELDDDKLFDIVSRFNSGSSTAFINSGSMAAAIELYNQLKSSENIAKLLDYLIEKYTGVGDKIGVESKSASQVLSETLYKSTKTALGAGTIDLQEYVLKNIDIFFIPIEKLLEKDETRANLQLAVEIGWSGTMDLKTIETASKKTGGNIGFVGTEPENLDYGFVRRFIFCFVVALSRFYNSKLAKLEKLAPEKRRIQEHHYVFSGRDIIHNDITAMLGYNEGEFIFEKVSLSIGGTPGTNLWDKAKNLVTRSDTAINVLSIFGSDIERWPFFVDPVSGYEGNSFDYSAKRMFINLANPVFYSFALSMNNSTTESYSASRILTIMASNQMAEMVRDWYGGYLYTFGDASKRPADLVFTTDTIRDMYGPFEIKEAVYKFDIDGFTNSLSPSVFSYIDSRNITDQTATKNATTLLDAVLAIVGVVAVFKGGKVLGGLISKIPGVAKLFSKAGAAVTLRLAKDTSQLKLLPKAGNSVVNFGLKVTKKWLLDPVVRKSGFVNEKFSLDMKRKLVGATTKNKEFFEKAATDTYLKNNGFKDVDDFIPFIESLNQGKVTFIGSIRNTPLYTQTLAQRGTTSAKKVLTDAEITRMEELSNKLADGIKDFTKGLKERKFIDSKSSEFLEDMDELAILMKKAGFDTKSLIYGNFLSFGNRLAFPGRVSGALKLPPRNPLENAGGFRATYADYGTAQGVMGAYVVEDTRSFFMNFYSSGGRIEKKGLLEGMSDVEFKKVQDFVTKMGTSDGMAANVNIKRLNEFIGEVMSEFDDAEAALKAYKTFMSNLRGKGSSGVISFGKKQFSVSKEIVDIFEEEIVDIFEEEKEIIDIIAKHSRSRIKNNISQKLLADLEADPKLVPYQNLDISLRNAIDDLVSVEKKKADTAINQLQERLKVLREEGKKLTKGSIDERVNNEEISIVKDTVDKLRKGVSEIESKKTSPEFRKVVADNLRRASDEVIDNPDAFDIIKSAYKNELSLYADNMILTSGLSTVQGSLRTSSAKTLIGSVNDSMKARYTLPVTGKELLKKAGVVFGLYQAYSIISGVFGESIQDFAIRVGSQEASDALMTQFMIYKGEPYLANLEGLTRGSTSLIAPGSNYWDYLKARFSSLDRDISTIFSSIYGEALRTNLSQYTDVLASEILDTTYFASLDSEYKFGNKDVESAGAGIAGKIGSPNKNPSSLFGKSKPIYQSSPFGPRSRNGKEEFHYGIDITNGLRSSESPQNFIGLHEKAGVYAMEDSLYWCVTGDSNAKFSNFETAVARNAFIKPGPGVDGTQIEVYCFGLRTNTLWRFSHCYPLLEGESPSQNQLNNIRTNVKFVGSGTKIGMFGPFGLTEAPHVHMYSFLPKNKDNNPVLNKVRTLQQSLDSGNVTVSKELSDYIISIFKGPKRDTKANTEIFARADYEMTNPEVILSSREFGISGLFKPYKRK